MARKPRTKKGYVRQYAGKFRTDLPALIEKGWSGSKALNYLRKVKKYHLRTQTFYDILREEKAAYAKLPDAAELKPSDFIPDSFATPTDLKLTAKYQLFFTYDIYSDKGNFLRSGTYSIVDDDLGDLEYYISIISYNIETDDRYKKRKGQKLDVRNIQLNKVWREREEPLKRVKRGQRYET